MLTESELAFARGHLPFWDKLRDAEKASLERATVKASYPRGTVLRGGDSECLGVLIVLEGELRVYIQSEDGREVTLYRVSPGDVCVMSASCILNSISFDVSIDATKDSEIFRIGMGAFESVMKENVYVENFSYKSAMERFSDVMWAIEQILFMRFDARLAIFLLDESAKAPNGEIRATHDQIAKYVGSAREVVSRMLKNFEERGLVALARGTIRVMDRDALKKFL